MKSKKKDAIGCHLLSGLSPTLALSKDVVVYSGGTWFTRGNLLVLCVTILSSMLLKEYSHFRTAKGFYWQNFRDDYYSNYLCVVLCVCCQHYCVCFN